MEQPVEMNSLILSPGERAEILLDLRSRETGDSLYLFTETFQGPRDEVLKIVVADRESRSHTPATQIPGRLVSIAEIPASQSLRSRRFDLETMEIPHSFHLHGVRFQILDINGKNPPAGESGWKDTVLVWPGDTVRIIIPFREFPGIYMYHCHLLEHEDDGMMGQFEVVP